MTDDPNVPRAKLGFYWTAALVVGGLALAVLIAASAVDGCDRGGSDGKLPPNTASARREFVTIIGEKFPAGAVSTEGSEDQGLIVNLNDCTLGALNELLTTKSFVSRLEQLDFKWIRCPGGIKITAPWE